MLRSVQRSIGLKLAVAVAVPSFAVALGGALWLHRAAARASSSVPASGVVLAALVVFAVAMATTHVIAARILVERPLNRLAEALRRARDDGFLQRLEPGRGDAFGALAADLDTTLAAVTDLDARRLEDAASTTTVRPELALNAQLEARVRELTLLHDLGSALASTLDPDAVVGHVEALVRRRLPCDAFEVRLDGRRARHAPAAAVEIPMLHGGARIGALLLSRAREVSAEERSLLESIASQAALALVNARLHQETVHLSRTDPLTGVANRRALFDRLRLELERCERYGETLAVALVDVDHFKQLNDRIGHTGGDAILRRVAGLLSAEVRRVDLVARYGGEEFAVVLPGADRTAALAVGEKLRAAIASARFEHRGAPVGGAVRISVGVAVHPEDARDLSSLIDCADAALYAAKRAGRDAVRACAAGMREHPGRERDVSITAGEDPPG